MSTPSWRPLGMWRALGMLRESQTCCSCRWPTRRYYSWMKRKIQPNLYGFIHSYLSNYSHFRFCDPHHLAMRTHHCSLFDVFVSKILFVQWWGSTCDSATSQVRKWCTVFREYFVSACLYTLSAVIPMDKKKHILYQEIWQSFWLVCKANNIRLCTGIGMCGRPFHISVQLLYIFLSKCSPAEECRKWRNTDKPLWYKWPQCGHNYIFEEMSNECVVYHVPLIRCIPQIKVYL